MFGDRLYETVGVNRLRQLYSSLRERGSLILVFRKPILRASLFPNIEAKFAVAKSRNFHFAPLRGSRK